MAAVVSDAKGGMEPPAAPQWLRGGLSGGWIVVQGLLKPSGTSLLTVLDTGCLIGKATPEAELIWRGPSTCLCLGHENHFDL